MPAALARRSLAAFAVACALSAPAVPARAQAATPPVAPPASPAPPATPPTAPPAIPAPTATPAAPAPPLAVPTVEQVEVGLHLIEVVALDRDGRPLDGLTPANFEVTVDRGERPVVSLDPPRTPAPVAPLDAAPGGAPRAAAQGSATAPPGGEPPRWVLVFLDADRIFPTNRQEALRALHALVTVGLRPRDRVAVMLAKRGEAQFLQRFTPVSAFDPALVRDPDILLSPTPAPAQKTREMVELVSSCRDARDPLVCVSRSAAEYLQTTRADARMGLTALRAAVSALAPLPGRKALVIVGDGLLTTPGAVAIAAAQRFTGTAVSSIESRLVDPPSLESETLVSEAQRARVSVFGVRTGGVNDFEMFGAGSTVGDVARDRSGVNPFAVAGAESLATWRRAAEATGGRILDTMTAKNAPETVFDRLQAVYTLGIVPLKTDSPRSRVRVKLVGVRGTLDAPDRLARLRRAARDVVGAPERAPIDPRAPADAPVRVTVALDPRTLTAPPEDPRARRCAIYARVLDAKGALVHESYETYELRLPDGPAPARLEQPLDLPAGPPGATITVRVADLLGDGQATFSAVRPVP